MSVVSLEAIWQQLFASTVTVAAVQCQFDEVSSPAFQLPVGTAVPGSVTCVAPAHPVGLAMLRLSINGGRDSRIVHVSCPPLHKLGN